jgi:hypothetical protein
VGSFLFSNLNACNRGVPDFRLYRVRDRFQPGGASHSSLKLTFKIERLQWRKTWTGCAANAVIHARCPVGYSWLYQGSGKQTRHSPNFAKIGDKIQRGGNDFNFLRN